RLASASKDGTLKIWDGTTGQEALTLKGHTGEVYTAAFSADGRLASVSADQTVRLWDVAAARETAAFKGHKGAAYAVAVSPDGKSVASASQDKTEKIWQAPPAPEASSQASATPRR